MPKESIRLLFFSLFATGFLGSYRCQGQHMNAPHAPCRNAGPNAAVTQCFLKESDKANTRLNLLYGRILRALDPDEVKELKVAQRYWLQFRDANCEAERKLYEGGSAAPTVQAACMAADTEERTQELQTMYGWRLEK